MVVLTAGESEGVTKYAQSIAEKLAFPSRATFVDETKPLPLFEPQYIVDTDFRSESLSKKVRSAKQKKYDIICIIGERNMKEQILDLDISGLPEQEKTIEVFNLVKRGISDPVQDTVPRPVRNVPGIKATLEQTLQAMKILNHRYL